MVRFKQSHLIIWAFVLLTFALGLVFKINFSSLALWDSYLGGNNPTQQGILFGTPKGIRSDEWMLGVPWVMSQVNSNPAFSTQNPAVGAETASLLVGLPTEHWSAIFRPALWGYYFLDLERGFSWHWMFRTFGLFVALAVFFRFALSCSMLVSLTGAGWIYFSAFNQWWLASVSEIIFSFLLTCIGFSAVFKSNSILRLAFSSELLLLGIVGFGLTLYPPFQVPLFYLGLCLIPFLLPKNINNEPVSSTIKIAVLISTALTSVALLYLFLVDNKETVSLMQSTVYPGQRLSFGGGYNLSRYFSGFFDSIYSEGLYPQSYGNVCEASSFLLLWPISLLIACLSRQSGFLIKSLPLIVYLIFASIWVSFGTNPLLAKLTLWSMVPSNRALIGLGIGSIIYSILVIDRVKKPTTILVVLLCVIFVTLLWDFLHKFQALPIRSMSNQEFNFVIASSILILVSLISSSRTLLAASILFGVVYPNSSINPVMSGMDSIVKSAIYQAVQSIDTDKSEKWAVYGSPIVPQIVKAAGAKVINGALYAPDLESLRVFDPEGKYIDIYNRYSHVTLNQVIEGQPLRFHLHQADTWQLDISPCDPAFKTLKVRYFVFMPRRKSLKYSCLNTVFKGRNFSIFERNDF
jgi:hypothetical protein